MAGSNTPYHHGGLELYRPNGLHRRMQSNVTVPSPATKKLSSVDETMQEKNFAIVDSIDLSAEDEEGDATPPRPFLLTHSVMIGIAMGLLMVSSVFSLCSHSKSVSATRKRRRMVTYANQKSPKRLLNALLSD